MVAVLADTAPGHQLLAGSLASERTVPYGLRLPKAGWGELRQRPVSHALQGGTRKLAAGPDVQLNDARLATALMPVVGADPGRLAAGVIDLTTGASATYNSGTAIRDGGLVTADIVAALLLQHQQAGTRVTAREAELAAAMMESGSSAATSQLWGAIGGAPGLAAANATLGLHATTMMPVGRGSWQWTQTTVADQLRLLGDLTGQKSPLRVTYRDYALGLMESSAAHPWDVLAASTAGTPAAVADGSLVGPRWVIGSIGVIQRNGHELLVAVLSDRNPGQWLAVTAAQAAALAAAGLVS